jgi:glucose 1-dehydrogenase/3-oxoacyl-[acyl-carrier protein] reductase
MDGLGTVKTGTRLDGRRALVTGAGIGIGRAIARGLADAGAAVVLHHRDHGEGAQAEVDAITAAGGNATALEADLSDLEAGRDLVARAVDWLGGLDILVNNAGRTVSGPMASFTAADFDAVVRLNIGAAYFCTAAAIPALATSGHGSVVNMASVHGQASGTSNALYAATRGAVIAMTRSQALELAPQRIRVNALGPGVIEVPRYFDDPAYTTERGGRAVPLGRVGRPEDVADVAVFMASDAASFVTGTVLWVDGGTMARLNIGDLDSLDFDGPDDAAGSDVGRQDA